MVERYWIIGKKCIASSDAYAFTMHADGGLECREKGSFYTEAHAYGAGNMVPCTTTVFPPIH